MSTPLLPAGRGHALQFPGGVFHGKQSQTQNSVYRTSWFAFLFLGFNIKFKYDNRVQNTGMQSADHEAAVIRAFVQRDKQERFLVFLATPKNRKKFTDSLSHFRWFDQRFTASMPWKVDPKLKPWAKHVSGIKNICRLLKSKGAGPTCWAISEDAEIDGRELDLSAAIEHVNGRGIGTILSCVPGKLAYFESEDETLLLAR
jgi:hypothetical protein